MDRFNRYSLASDSSRWWYPSAMAGTIGAAAVCAILVVPAAGVQAPAVRTPVDDAAVPSDTGPMVRVPRPCYMARRGWNTPAGWEQPVCFTEIRRAAEGASRGTGRTVPDYLP